MLEEFSVKSELDHDVLINVLIQKMDRNMNVHHHIDNFLNDVSNGSRKVDDFIQHIEKINKLNLVISNSEKEILIKLIRLNISYQKEKRKM